MNADTRGAVRGEWDAEQRRVVVATCVRRAALELQGAAAFTRVTQSLIDLRADIAILNLSARAIPEEIRHAEVYRSLASLFAGSEIPSPVPAPILWPSYDGVDQGFRAVLDVVGMCAINETMACGFLQECLAGTTDRAVRAGLQDVLGDEIRHGRIGWAWLAAADPDATERAEIGKFVLPLLRAQVRGWRTQIATVPAPEVPALGCPSGAAIERAMLASIRDLVLPGFEHLGIDVGGARSWTEAGAPT